MLLLTLLSVDPLLLRWKNTRRRKQKRSVENHQRYDLLYYDNDKGEWYQPSTCLLVEVEESINNVLQGIHLVCPNEPSLPTAQGWAPGLYPLIHFVHPIPVGIDKLDAPEVKFLCDVGLVLNSDLGRGRHTKSSLAW